MSTQDEDIDNLPLENRLTHKIWKVRMEAYKELGKELEKWDPVSDEHRFRDFSDSMAKLVAETNVAAQEAGVNTLLIYLRNAPSPTRTRASMQPILMEKCVASTRAGTRTAALEALMLYVEVDVAEPVVEELINVLKHKQPKVVAANLSAIREIICQFGAQTAGLKPILKTFPQIFAHADKNVRAEAQRLVVEVYRWIRDATLPYISELKPVQQNDLKAAFASLTADPVSPTRLLRSEQARLAEQEAAAVPDTDIAVGNDAQAMDGGSLGAPPNNAIDPYDLADPVSILSKLPEDFEESMKSTKWKDRKAAMENLQGLVNVVRLEVQPYDSLMALLAKHVHDNNIIVATLAISCIEYMAKGLRNDFASYTSVVTSPLIEKCKEKKANVVQALRNTLDAVFLAVGSNLAIIQSDIETAMGHKNPQVKAESVRWFTRCLQVIKECPSKRELPDLVTKIGLRAMDDGATDVRDAGANMLGHLMKCVGSDTLKPFLGELDKIKETKVMECFDNATVVAKPVRPKPIAPPPARVPPSSRPRPSVPKTMKPAPAVDSDLAALEALAPPVKPILPPKLRKKPPGATKPASNSASTPASKPKLSLQERLPAKAPAAAAAGRKPAAVPAPVASKLDEPIRYKFNNEVLAEIIPQFINDELMDQLNSANWKHRLAAMEGIMEDLKSRPSDSIEAEVIVRQMLKKPGLKEANFQVIQKVYQLFQFLAQNVPSFGRPSVALAVQLVAEKLGDIKLKKAAAETLEGFAETFSLPFVLSQAYAPISKQKSPKVLADSMKWINSALRDFGVGGGLNVRNLTDFLKTIGLNSSNAGARASAVTVITTLCHFLGPQIMSLIQDINAKTLELVEAEYDKVKDEPPPTPTRGPALAADDGGAPGGTAAGNSAGDALDDIFPRVDITPMINSKLVTKLREDNWKLRKEGLEQVQEILRSANNRIKPTVGELWSCLKARLSDANKNLIALTCDIVATVATAMGKPFEKQARAIVGPLLHVLADKKVQVRTAGINALTSIAEAGISLDTLASLSGPVLMTDSPNLRKDLLEWWVARCGQGENLPDLSPFVGPILECLQDRSVEVRKPAQAMLRFVVQSAGYVTVKEKAMAAKGTARQSLMVLLEPYHSTSGTSLAANTVSSASQPSGMTPSAGTTRKPPPASGSSPTKLTKAQLFSRREGGGLGAGRSGDGSGSGADMRRSNTLTGSGTAVTTGSTLQPRLSLRRRLGSGQGPTGVPSRLNSSLASAGGHHGTLSGRATPSPTMAAAPSPADLDQSPLIINSDPRAKEIRMRKDAGLNKWGNDGIRPEMVHSLAMQMEPHVNPTLHRLLFSTDHHKDRDYIRAMSLLDEALLDPDRVAQRSGISGEEYRQRIVAHLDLWLKYLTVRFQDTITNIWLKCLEFLDHLVTLLEDVGYHWTEYEAAIFLPSFIGKFGDPKEVVRGKVTTIFRRMCHTYPVSRMFQYLVDYGLRSKNARVRGEALEELANIIQRNGMGVCQPAKFIPLAASFIGDRDATVRSAALNALVQVYLQIGDGIFGLVGRLSEKDKTILEEKFKRTKLPTDKAWAGTPTTSSLPRRMGTLGEAGSRLSRLPAGRAGPGGVGERLAASRIGQPRGRPLSVHVGSGRTTCVVSPTLEEAHGVGGMVTNEETTHSTGDRFTMAQRRDFSLDLDQLNLPKLNLSQATIRPTHSGRPAATNLSSAGRIRPASLYAMPETQSELDYTSSTSSSTLGTQDYMLDVILAQITSTDPAASTEALRYLEKVCTPQGKDQLLPQINQFVNSLALQLRFAFTLVNPAAGQEVEHMNLHAPTSFSPTQFKLCKRVIHCCMQLFSVPALGKGVTAPSLRALLFEILQRLLDPRLSALEDNEHLTRAMNVLVMRILENSDPNYLYSALFTILGEACQDLQPESVPMAKEKSMFADLTMKCVWKLSKRLREDLRRQLIRVNEFVVTVNDFFVSWPAGMWKQRIENNIMFGDIPYRTVKSVLYDLASVLNEDLLNHLDGLPDKEASPLYQYLCSILGSGSSTRTTTSGLSRVSGLDSNGDVDHYNSGSAGVSLATVSDNLSLLKSRIQGIGGRADPHTTGTGTDDSICTTQRQINRPRPLSMQPSHSPATSGVLEPEASQTVPPPPNSLLIPQPSSPEVYKRNLHQWQQRLGYHTSHSNQVNSATPTQSSGDRSTLMNARTQPLSQELSASPHPPPLLDNLAPAPSQAPPTASGQAPQLRPFSHVHGHTVEDLRARLAKMKTAIFNNAPQNQNSSDL
ncbi:hypothetical protein IWQ61_000993 [Dispira simplex]|nr:hypothetical protein IWQ61_000993 [Dispira simplex]